MTGWRPNPHSRGGPPCARRRSCDEGVLPVVERAGHAREAAVRARTARQLFWTKRTSRTKTARGHRPKAWPVFLERGRAVGGGHQACEQKQRERERDDEGQAARRRARGWRIITRPLRVVGSALALYSGARWRQGYSVACHIFLGEPATAPQTWATTGQDWPAPGNFDIRRSAASIGAGVAESGPVVVEGAQLRWRFRQTQ